MAPTIEPERLMQVLESRTSDEGKGQNYDEIKAMTRLNLMRLATHLKLEFKQSVTKPVIYELVLYCLVDKDLILDSVLDKEEKEDTSTLELLKAKLELERVQKDI